MENRPTLLCAALADKDVAGIVDVLIPAFPRVVVTQTDSDRALPAEELAALVDADKLAGVYPSVSEALRLSMPRTSLSWPPAPLP